MNLIQKGEFKLHSKLMTDVKIDCDALTYEELDVIAYTYAHRGDRFSGPLRTLRFPFTEVLGIPSGGVALAARFQKYLQPFKGQDRILIVDDVLTTGNSIHEFLGEIRKERPDAMIEYFTIFDRKDRNAYGVGCEGTSLFTVNTEMIFSFRDYVDSPGIQDNFPS